MSYNENTTGQRNRLDYLQRNADTLFTLTPLRNTLWRLLNQSIRSTKQHADYSQKMNTNMELLMAWDMMRLWQSTIAEIHSLHDNLFPGEDFVMTMLELRTQVIEEFAKTKPASWWSHVSADDEQSVHIFANRLYQQLAGKEITLFYHQIDKLGILTDLINHRDHLYDMKLDYKTYSSYTAEQRNRENEHNALTTDMLRQAVEECSYLFWSQVSWYVVYAICTEDYGFSKNMSAFERDVQEMNARVDYGCPKGTLQSALSSNECFKHPSNEWHNYHPAQRVFALHDKLREVLKKNQNKHEP